MNDNDVEEMTFTDVLNLINIIFGKNEGIEIVDRVRIYVIETLKNNELKIDLLTLLDKIKVSLIENNPACVSLYIEEFREKVYKLLSQN